MVYFCTRYKCLPRVASLHSYNDIRNTREDLIPDRLRVRKSDARADFCNACDTCMQRMPACLVNDLQLGIGPRRVCSNLFLNRLRKACRFLRDIAAAVPGDGERVLER